MVEKVGNEMRAESGEVKIEITAKPTSDTLLRYCDLLPVLAQS